MPSPSKERGDLAWTKNVSKIEKFKIKELQGQITPSKAPSRKVPLLPSQAASKIQAGFKGMKARREVKELKEKDGAARMIQANFKGMKARREFKERREQDKAAKKIQAGFKGMKVRKEMKERDEAAKKIQAGFKGMQTRRAMMRPGEKLWRKLKWKIRMVARMALEKTSKKSSKKAKKGSKSNPKQKTSSLLLPGDEEGTSGRRRRVSLKPVRRGSTNHAVQPIDPTLNRGFILIAPHCNTGKTQETVRQILTSNKITVISEGKIPSKVIDQEFLVDQQYYKMASIATLLKPGQAPINAEVFERLTGVGWRTVLDKRMVFNALDACDALGVDAERLSEMWAAADAKGKVYTVGDCQQCGILQDNSGKKTIYVLNGFFMANRSTYTQIGAVVYYYSIKWSSSKMTYAKFLSDVAGVSLPGKAKNNTIRNVMDKRWKSLGQKVKPTSKNLGVHVSSSNLQALLEQLIWMRSKIEKEPYARLLEDEGVEMSTIRRWKTNPKVFSSKAMKETDHIFNVLKGKDATECTAVIKVIQSLESESKLAAPSVAIATGQKAGEKKQGAKVIKEQSSYKSIIGKVAAAAKQTIKYNPKAKRKGGGVVTTAKRKGFQSMGAKKQERELKRKSKDQYSSRNHALILVEHYAITEKTVHMIQDTLKEHHMNLRSKGVIGAEEIRSRRIVDQHFYAQAKKATGLNPKDVNIPRLKFQSKFGTAWSQILKDGVAFNVLQATDELKMSELDLAERWATAVEAGNVLMSDQGWVGRVTVPKKNVKSVKGKKGTTGVFICGGDFLAIRARFTKPGTSTYYFSVDWDPKVMKWADFNEQYIGHSKEAPEHSLNQLIRGHWDSLDLKRAPPDDEDFVHGSLSPVDAMNERMNWLDFSGTQDYFARALQQVGLTPAAIMHLRFDPEVKRNGRQRQPVSWSVHGMDVADCIAYCGSIKDELDDLAHSAAGTGSSDAGAWGRRGGSNSIQTKTTGATDDDHVELKIKDTGLGGSIDESLLFPAKLADEISFISFGARASSSQDGGRKAIDNVGLLLDIDTDGGEEEINAPEKGSASAADDGSIASSAVQSTSSAKEQGEKRRKARRMEKLSTAGTRVVLEDSMDGEINNDDATSDGGDSTAPLVMKPKLLSDVSRYLRLKDTEKPRLLELEFNGEDVEDDDVLKICDKIETSADKVSLLNLSNNEVGDAGAEAIGDLLVDCTAITQEVDLSANKVGNNGVKHIAGGLAQNTVLKSINLNENEFDEGGATELFRAVAVNKSLESIDVGANNLGVTGAEALVKMMQINSTLIKVDTLEASGITKSQRKVIDALLEVNAKQSLSPKAISTAKRVILSSMPTRATIGGSANGGIVIL